MEVCGLWGAQFISEMSLTPLPPAKKPRGSPSDQLAKQGYTVLPVFTEAEVKRIRLGLDEEIQKFPEFRDPPPRLESGPPLVGGGFGALANPGSYHNPVVRAMRLRALKAVLSEEAIPVPPGFYLSQVFDRLMVRKAGQTPTPENWHQDTAGRPLPPGAALYGGWIALDHQELSCKPGTQLAVNPGVGFVKASGNPGESAEKRVVPVPAGHMLIFNETLMHEIRANKNRGTKARLFTAWAVLPTAEPLYPFEGIIEDQAVPPLKSGQMPAMLPKMYINQLRVNHGRIDALGSALKPVATSEHRIGAGSKYLGGQTVRVPGNGTRPMGSLKSMGLPMYPPYSAADSRALTPMQDPYAVDSE